MAMLANPADAAIGPFGAAQASAMRPAAANGAYFTVDESLWPQISVSKVAVCHVSTARPRTAIRGSNHDT
jgi:hypothetical protein